MSSPMVSEKVSDDQIGVSDLRKELEELAHIAANLRFWSRYWHEHYGSAALSKKKAWEKRMDDKLANYGITGHLNSNAVQYYRDDEGNFTQAKK